MRQVFRDAHLQAGFERDGYVVVDFIDSAQVERLTAAWNALPSEVQEFPFSNTIMSRSLEYRARVHDTVRRELEQRTGDLLLDYRLCLCSFNAKPAARSAGTGVVELHQDWTFVDESQFFSIGIWCPLVDVNEENGCLRVVPQSHQLNMHPRCLATPFPYSDLLPCFQTNYLKPIPMKAGQAFVYSNTLFHSSAPNMSNALRLVAGGMAIPRETPLLFLAPAHGEHAADLAVYEVDDAFYQQYRFEAFLDVGRPVRFIRHAFEPLSEAILHDRLGGAS